MRLTIDRTILRTMLVVAFVTGGFSGFCVTLIVLALRGQL